MGGFEESRAKLESIKDDLANPFWQQTTREYALSVIEESQPYRDTLILSGYEDIKLGTIALAPGNGRLTVVKDNIPFVIKSGLDGVCSSLLGVINQDKVWRRLSEEGKAVQQAYVVAFFRSHNVQPSPSELSLFDIGLSVIGCASKEWLGHSDEERTEIVRAKMSELSSEALKHPNVRVDNLDYLGNIRLRGVPVLQEDLPVYHSYCADSRKIVRGLEDCMALASRRTRA